MQDSNSPQKTQVYILVSFLRIHHRFVPPSQHSACLHYEEHPEKLPCKHPQRGEFPWNKGNLAKQRLGEFEGIVSTQAPHDGSAQFCKVLLTPKGKTGCVPGVKLQGFVSKVEMGLENKKGGPKDFIAHQKPLDPLRS